MVVADVTERIAILGSTGSVGCNTLDVVRMHPDRYRVAALSAQGNDALMLEQCLEFAPERVVMVDPAAASRLRAALQEHGLEIDVQCGASRLDALVDDDIATVVCAIVGAAGLRSTLAAVRAGMRVLVANKEPLVMLGRFIMDLAIRHGATILPLDSEHNAIFQCLPMGWQETLGVAGSHHHYGVRRLLLTGSGGPFRETASADLDAVTPDQACNHPNWNMGRKISVDSATMMNKGLELIEACELFALDESAIEIVVHPQSVVHSMVEYVDGSVLAQMAVPDMRVPIASALAWPARVQSGVQPLDLFTSNRFDFMPPDPDRFPALSLARDAARHGGSAPCILNAANEVAVDAFLNERIGFRRITELVAATLEKIPASPDIDLETALAHDADARRVCEGLIS